MSRPTIYPWADWLDGSLRKVNPADWNRAPASLAKVIRARARLLGLDVQAACWLDGTVVFQSFEP